METSKPARQQPERRPVNIGLTIPRDTLDLIIALVTIDRDHQAGETDGKPLTPGHIFRDAINAYIGKRFDEDPEIAIKIKEAYERRKHLYPPRE